MEMGGRWAALQEGAKCGCGVTGGLHDVKKEPPCKQSQTPRAQKSPFKQAWKMKSSWTNLKRPE